MHEPRERIPASSASADRPAPDLVAVLVENHRRFLAFLERRVGSREAAEDILQDAFVRGLTRGGQLREAKSATAWFYRLLRNALADHWRRTRAERRALDRAATLAEEDAEATDEELMDTVCRCITDLVDTLKPEYAAALRRVDLDGASVKAFAEETGITANNASVRLFRAREALLKQVQASCGTCAEHGCVDCRCGAPGGNRPPAGC
jgi:RNA polymerase sigma-70 factor (ECF subfamily)